MDHKLSPRKKHFASIPLLKKQNGFLHDRTGDRTRVSSLEIELQAFDRAILLTTPFRGLSGSLGKNLKTFLRLLSTVFLGMRSPFSKSDLIFVPEKFESHPIFS